MEINFYIINMKATVTWHHDYYWCQEHKKVINVKIKILEIAKL